MARSSGESRALVFRPRHRLRHRLEFASVYGARIIARQGPLTVFGKPSGRPEARLGLSVGRRVGSAVVRNGAKRRIREAFRMTRAVFERPDGALDIVVVVAAHDPLPPEDYRRLLAAAAQQIWKQSGRRSRHAQNGPTREPGGKP